jgi:hypothetical protein
MTHRSIAILLLCAMAPIFLSGTIGAAQTMIPPGSSSLSPPPPAPPPPPKIEVPVVPKLDEMPRQPATSSPSRGSFSDRMTDCLQDAASLRPRARAAYARACANR